MCVTYLRRSLRKSLALATHIFQKVFTRGEEEEDKLCCETRPVLNYLGVGRKLRRRTKKAYM